MELVHPQTREDGNVDSRKVRRCFDRPVMSRNEVRLGGHCGMMCLAGGAEFDLRVVVTVRPSSNLSGRFLTKLTLLLHNFTRYRTSKRLAQYGKGLLHKSRKNPAIQIFTIGLIPRDFKLGRPLR